MIGGAAGAVPALVGWAAVTGTVGAARVDPVRDRVRLDAAALLGARDAVPDDYAAAGIPMLPVVRGPEETRKQILLYSLVLFGTSLLLVPFGDMGPVYAIAALVLGGWFVWRALRLWLGASGSDAAPVPFSIVYLALLFAAVAVDASSAASLRRLRRSHAGGQPESSALSVVARRSGSGACRRRSRRGRQERHAERYARSARGSPRLGYRTSNRPGHARAASSSR